MPGSGRWNEIAGGRGWLRARATGTGEGTRGGQYSGPVAHEPEPVHDHHDDPAFITRTKFLTGVAVVTGGVMTAAILVPVVGFAAADALKEEEWRWVDIGPLSDFPDGQTTSIAVSGPTPSPTGAPTCATRTARSSRSGTAAPTWAARSPTRPAATSYACPCHGGAYNSLGLVTAGPPPRPLDRFDVKLVDGATARTIARQESRPTACPTARAQADDARAARTAVLDRRRPAAVRAARSR